MQIDDVKSRLSSLRKNAVILKINKLRIVPFILLCLLFSSCDSWVKFDAYRMIFGFIFTLVVGIVGLLIMITNRKNKK